MKKALTIGIIMLFFAMAVVPVVNSSFITTATRELSKTIEHRDTQVVSNDDISVDINLTATQIRWRT